MFTSKEHAPKKHDSTICTFIFCLQILGNLPVEWAKDAVCFLQWCGVSLVSSYAVCFLQRGGVSLVSSAIIYNIVKVKVTCWPVDPFDPLTHRAVDPLTRRPVDLFEKEALKAIARSTYIHRWDVTRVWPVDPSTRWPFRNRTPQGQLRGAPTYIVEMQYVQQKAQN